MFLQNYHYLFKAFLSHQVLVLHIAGEFKCSHWGKGTLEVFVIASWGFCQPGPGRQFLTCSTEVFDSTKKFTFL